MAGNSTKVAVVGAGAIGGVTAAFLARQGCAVELVCKHDEIAALAIDPGLEISGVRGRFIQAVRAVARIDQLSGPHSLVFLATKSADAVPAAEELLPLLTPDAQVVSLQNGVAEDALAHVLGRQRVVGCVVGWGATMLRPARLEMTSTGEWVLGSLEHRPDPRLEPVAELLAAVAPARISNNIMGELYGKLIVNACINSLGVITGQRLGPMLANADIQRVFIALMREAMSVAGAMGLRVEPGGGGKLDYYQFLASSSALAQFKRRMMIRLIGFKYRRITSSSLQSLQRGRPTEVDYLNGYICAKGREHGVATPLNDRVVEVIKEIEAGKRQIPSPRQAGRLRLQRPFWQDLLPPHRGL